MQRVIFRYSLFAFVATFANLATQRIVLSAGNTTLMFICALAAGTVVGLIIKYVLDKRWVFYDVTSGAKAHREKFSLYALTGIFTTLVFWGTESIFWLVSPTDFMRECGAVLGLSIGYVMKYRLDRRFVFPDKDLKLPEKISRTGLTRNLDASIRSVSE